MSNAEGVIDNSKGVKWYEAYGVLADLLVCFYEEYGEKSGEKLFELLNSRMNEPKLKLLVLLCENYRDKSEKGLFELLNGRINEFELKSLILFCDKHRDKSEEELLKLLEKKINEFTSKKDNKKKVQLSLENYYSLLGIFYNNYNSLDDKQQKSVEKQLKKLNDFYFEVEQDKKSLFKLIEENPILQFRIENYTWFETLRIDFLKIPKTGSIDPLHIFASFNGNRLTIETKLQRLDLYIKIIKKGLEDRIDENSNLKKKYNNLKNEIASKTLSRKGFENGFYSLVKETIELVDSKEYEEKAKKIKEIYDYAGSPSPQIGDLLKPRKMGKNKLEVPEQCEKDVWQLFHNIKSKDKIEDKMTDSNRKLLDNAMEIDSVGFVMLTIFLFWTDYKYFLPLDKNTLTLLKKRQKLTVTPGRFYKKRDKNGKFKEEDEGQHYLNLLKYENGQYVKPEDGAVIYPQLTNLNWIYVTRVDEVKIDLTEANTKKSDLEILLIKYGLKPRTVDYNGFQIIGLKALKEYDDKGKELEKYDNDAYIKSLKRGKPYNLYHAYTINDDNTIKYDASKNSGIYHLIKDKDFTTVNISAIVGKNGTGKSTLTELILMAINNLYCRFATKDKNNDEDKINPKYVENLNIELYLKTTYVYKITFGKGEELIIEKYDNFDGYKYSKPTEIKDKKLLKEGDFAQFFTLNINYSIYGLNTKYDNHGWLTEVSNNESYDFPIILNPHKKDGNIDINNEQEVLKQRLIVNLLREDNNFSKKTDFEKYDFLQITQHQRAEKLKITRWNYIKDEAFEKLNIPVPTEDLHDELIKSLIESNFNNSVNHSYRLKKIHSRYTDNEPIFFRLVKSCIASEAYKIVNSYEQYSDFKGAFTDISKENRESKQKALFNRIYKNSNYFTHQIRQAIYFWKFHDKLKEVYEKSLELDLEELSKIIYELLKQKGKHTLQDLIPPPFFDIEIILDGENDKKNLTLEKLSSGEKQKIYSISSIFYHIQNVDSVNTSSSAITRTYRDVNIIFDEIELYFHPNLQREYIHDLLKALKKLTLENISGINIIFITHSPFILSDIPKSNICFLKRDDEEKDNFKNVDTFAANIHDLLPNGFFIDSTIGEFAASKIKEIVEFHDKVISGEKTKTDYEKVKNDFKFIYNHIGEDYVKSVIGNHISDIEARLMTDDERINSEIAQKRKALEKVQSELEALEVKQSEITSKKN